MENNNGNKSLYDAVTAEWEAQQEELKRYTLDPENLNVALNEVIDRLDEYFIEAALNFRINMRCSEGGWLNDRYLWELVHKLHPHIGIILNRLSANGGQLEDDAVTLTNGVQRWSYIVGLFMGAKLAGASRAQLEKLKTSLVA
jgi:hypothetical protein